MSFHVTEGKVKGVKLMSYNDYKDKICLLGLGVLDKSVGYLVKFEFQGNNQGNIKEILTLNNCLLFKQV